MLNLREQVALSDVEQFPLSRITELYSEVILPGITGWITGVFNAEISMSGSTRNGYTWSVGFA